MIPDPLPKPFRLPGTFAAFDPATLDHACAVLFPGHPAETYVLLASPADWAPDIIGSESAGKCGKCGDSVWLAPSSQKTGPWPLIVCVRCLVEALPADHPLKVGWYQPLERP